MIAKARANLYRRLRKLPAHAYPFAVNVDCLYIASDDPDPISAVPGLPIAPTLGSFKPAGSAPMAAALEALEAPDPIRALSDACR